MATSARRRHAEADEAGRLRARPTQGVKGPVEPGQHRLGIGGARDGVLFIPSGYRHDQPAPLLLCLHGAGGHAGHRIEPLQPEAERDGIVLVAPDSVGPTWDLLIGGLGPDLARIDQALASAFERLSIDPSRVAIEGFSDGASYALSIGLANGDLFSFIFAFSPGFMRPPEQQGRPRILVSHGTRDPVLPVSCSRRVVPVLRGAGYDVSYHEFDGRHEVPPQAIADAMEALRHR